VYSLTNLFSTARLAAGALVAVSLVVGYFSADTSASCQNPCGTSACASQIGCVSVGTTFCTYSGQLMRCEYVNECPSLSYVGPC
jgi:hypothetical protein